MACDGWLTLVSVFAGVSYVAWGITLLVWKWERGVRLSRADDECMHLDDSR